MRRSDVQFKAKVEDALFDAAPVIEATVIPKDWAPLPEVGPDFPYDGQPVWLTANGVDAHPATWRTTRAYDAINVKWVHEAYWARHNAGGQRIEFEPLGYKKMED
jgi:hypothetical protein